MGINFGRMAQGLATGYLGAAIKDKEAKDNARLEVVKAAGIDYYTNQLPAHKKSEASRAKEYNMLSKLLESEEAADYFEANGFITGDGKGVERVQSYLEKNAIKANAFKNYIPAENYKDRYNARQTDFETRFAPVAKTLTMQQGGLGKSTVDGLLTKPEGEGITSTQEIITPAVARTQVEGTPIMTEGTPESTETITTNIPRSTADSAMSDFFITKSGAANLGDENKIKDAVSSFRGFGDGITKDAMGNTNLNLMGNKLVEYNAMKSVMNNIAGRDQDKYTVDGKVSLSLVAEAGAAELGAQTQGTIGFNKISIVDGYTKGTAKGGEVFTATGFCQSFNMDYPEPEEKRKALLKEISELTTKSEAQYFAMSFPIGLKFYESDKQTIRQYLITVTQ